MKVTFRLKFHTRYGQGLFLSGNHELFGSGVPEAAIPMQYLHESAWQISMELPDGSLPEGGIEYHYVLRESDGSFEQDWGMGRTLDLSEFTGLQEVLILDTWKFAGAIENVFYTEPFQGVLLKNRRCEVGSERSESLNKPHTHTFRVHAPLLTQTQTLCLLGSDRALDCWNTEHPVLLLQPVGRDHFEATVDLSAASFPIEYKYGVFDLGERRFIRFEDGANRKLNSEDGNLSSIALATDDDAREGRRFRTLVNDGFAVLPTDSWKGAGVAIPVFSLRSRQSCGVGEFADLRLLVDWARQVGLRLIQLLPVNDTTATHTQADSYPYAAVSAFALHPIYLNLDTVVPTGDGELRRELDAVRLALNAGEVLDYEAVMRCKMALLRRVYPDQKSQVFSSRAFRSFLEENREWLIPYAAFCFLRDRYGTVDFHRWPEHSRFDQAAVEALSAEGSPNYDGVAFHYFVQFHLHMQLRAAADYAHAHGVILKGDIAIGVFRHGADAWQQPELYHLDMQAGAPPDAFAVKGQNWGFPTYNWDRMQADGFRWWRRRFEQMSRYFDAFRIDHILGFFRIWSVPLDAVEGILGRFVRALPINGAELVQRGIALERGRLVDPWITDEVLTEAFGARAEEVKSRFLEAAGAGGYAMREGFSSQRQIADYFASIDQTDANKQLQEGLFDLVSNVILLVEAGGAVGSEEGGFHCRFSVEDTSSFRALDTDTQQRVRELYVDYFFRRQEAFWMAQGMSRLPAIKRATNMLVCGEDLGLVPACVPEAMRKLGLLSLEVQRMPKRQGVLFSRPAEAPYLSVVTPSTHDMSTIRGWWEEEREVTERFYREELGCEGVPPAACEPEINRAVVEQHLASPAMWSIFQLQDLLGMDGELRRADPHAERINVPANPKNYWGYRMHLTLEALSKAERFNEEIRAMTARHGRSPEVSQDQP